MDIAQTLEQSGLSNKEISVYLSCLEQGPSAIAVLARNANQKRSTMYHVLDGLISKGFVVQTTRGRRTLYDAERPEKLLQTLRNRERELESILPQLELLRGKAGNPPRTYHYEGDAGVEKVYKEIYNCIADDDEVLFLTSIGDLQTYAEFAIEKYYAILKKKKDAKVRELILNDAEGRKYVRWARRQGHSQPLKLLPKDFLIHNDLVLYKKKVALFSFHKRAFVIVIDDADVAQTLRTLYELAWKTGKNVR